MIRLPRWLRCTNRKEGGIARQPGCAEQSADPPISKTKIGIGAAVLLVLVGVYWALSETGALSALGDEQALRSRIDRLGVWGPLAVIVLEAAAIVMSPIPSGPIAIAAGAAYGPLWGTAYIVAGAEAGALIAFAVARCLGYEAMRRWLRGRLSLLTRHRSQRALMAIVFASRLLPFISFDAVSYAAGLTPLAFWRFAVATLAGVIPVSFLLAYFGEELISAGSENIVVAALLVGGITVLPIGAKLVWTWYRKQKNATAAGQRNAGR